MDTENWTDDDGPVEKLCNLLILSPSLSALTREAFHPHPGQPGTNLMTETGGFPPLKSLVISPNLQALLEFDDRLRTPSGSNERPGAEPPGLGQPSQYPSWRTQEVPTVSLPPPRRKKGVVTGVPMSPKTVSESKSVSSPTNTSPGAGDFGGLGEIMFARPEDAMEVQDGVRSGGSMNPYLNSPPSTPRYFYPRSDDEEEGTSQRSRQRSPFYTLEKSRSRRRPKRQSSDSQSPVERKGGQLVPPRYFTFGYNAGSRLKEKGEILGFPSL